MYIYIYIEREREREIHISSPARETEPLRNLSGAGTLRERPPRAGAGIEFYL